MDNRSINLVLSRLRRGDASALEELPPEEQKLIERILSQITTGKSKILDDLWMQDYDRKPASIDEFLDNDYYLGKVGSNIYPYWRRELRKVFDPRRQVSEWIIRGSIGAGKTSVSVITLLYKIHQLVCLKDPQKHYDLIEKSPIVFGLFNIWKYLAKSTAYNYLTEWTKLSRFFLEYQDSGDADYLKKGYIHFPKSLSIALGASAIHALGQNIFGGLLDEADMGRDKSSSNEEVSQVADSYGSVRSRMDSRFLQVGGSNPGLLILVSQVRGKDAFLEKHSAKMASDKHTRVTRFSLWEVKEWLFKNSKTFHVVVGDQRTSSYIPPTPIDPTTLREGLELLHVPEELKPRFEYDLDEAIRDLAGVATFGSDTFLKRRDKLFECYELATPRLSPFSKETIVLSIENDDTTSIVDSFVKERCMRNHDKATGAWIPRWYPGVDRAIHVDLSTSGDCTGVSMGCIGDIREVIRFDEDERPYKTRDYSVFVDFAIQLKAAKGSQIDYSKIRSFIFYLNSIGFRIKWVSYDGFQSTDSLQQLKKSGFDVSLLSMDKKPDFYNSLKNTIYESRLDIYEYRIFTEEMTKLQDRTLTGDKPAIDHPRGGSKDVTDSVCGVVTKLLQIKELLELPQGSAVVRDKLSMSRGQPADDLEKIADDSWVVPIRDDSVSAMDKLFSEED